MVKHTYPPLIRRLNPSRDLLAIADLIELCFAETLDQSGRDYIRQLRQIGKETTFFWFEGSSHQIYAPREGFVWEEQGKIIGNLSIFPFQTPRGIEYLIANVAVHPDFRRRGIARWLTERALDYIRERGGRQAWLNVREDNQAAIALYRELGFTEKLRRTHWQYLASSNAKQPSREQKAQSVSFQIHRRMAKEWETQKQWLLWTYPIDYHWHLDFHLNWFAPGFLSWLRELLNNNRFQHFSIVIAQQLVGVATLQTNARAEQFLWMACNPQMENEAFQAFLNYLLNNQTIKRKITLDYPAQRATSILQEFGFTPMQTLIWMHRSLTHTE
ncbi:MAG: GNAT family N-acetyltransferase [Anaerolineales bacterium]|nr:GNAT family N-acetyltransferase [Anaerolineales bacterium]